MESLGRRSSWVVRALFVTLLLLVFGVWLWMPSGTSLQGAPSRKANATDASDRALRTTAAAVARTWIADTPARELAWNWGEGVLVTGLQRAAQLTHASEIDDYVRDYLRAHAAHGVRVTWTDDTLPALAAAEFALRGEREFRPLVAQVVGYIMHAPRTRSGMLVHLGRTRLPFVRSWLPEVWVDSLFHVVPLLLRSSRMTGDVRYREQAVRQLLSFTRTLIDPASGLATHAYNDRTPAEPIPSFQARAFWARGNGWMLASLVDALAELPESHPDRQQLLAAAQRLAGALERAQAPSGLFHSVLLRADSYLETAGSALIIGALAEGVRLRLFPAATRAAVERGARGLAACVRRDQGRAIVVGTSLGTNPIEALYMWTPTADQISYGVGAWLMASSEIVRMRNEE